MNPLVKSTTRYFILSLLTVFIALFCISQGSVNIPLQEVAATFRDFFLSLSTGSEVTHASGSILLQVRTPRVLSAALVGAALTLSGAVMQGLLKNPLADGSTLGVSAGASLGAIIALAMGIYIPFLPFATTVVFAVLFAFLSLIFILWLAFKLDHSLSTYTIILMGIIFSMFVNSINSLIIVFAGDKLRSIVFWSMGSLSGSTYINVIVMAVSLMIFGGIILSKAEELNAFSLGEETARNLGVNVEQIKLMLLICASGLIGVAVSISGIIAFVGLVVPHITRLITGPNHRVLLGTTTFIGAIFLMLADLVARSILSPLELPIGVVTSIIGAVTFVYLFARKKA